MKINILIILLFVFNLTACAQESGEPGILTGAEQTELYVSSLVNKKVGVVVNHSSLIGNLHLIDTLLALKVDVVKIFTPEHGLQGIKDAGARVEDDLYKGVEVISLYGKMKKPPAASMKDLDIVIFDIQDVGVRFYTYVSTLHYVMETCAESKTPLMILDRPNPNGNYVDGPVLEPAYKSFIGMHPVPIVHGLTPGEFAQMINGEHWLSNQLNCELKIIPCKNYTHKSSYNINVNPSPNLKSMRSIYLYPGLCLLEGTVMSIGRGTDYPFEVIGHPDYPDKIYSFTPRSIQGSLNPKYKNQTCYGINYQHVSPDSLFTKNKMELKPLLLVYNKMNRPDNFFTNSFNMLAGSDELQKQIKDGLNEEEIRESWEDDLKRYKEVRKKYLLYPDFE